MIRLGLEPKTPTLKVLSLQGIWKPRLRLSFQMLPSEPANLTVILFAFQNRYAFRLVYITVYSRAIQDVVNIINVLNANLIILVEMSK